MNAPRQCMQRFSQEAMASIFEITIYGEHPCDAGAAAEAAFQELERLERIFSRFVESSDIARLNRMPVGEPLRVSADTLDCMLVAQDISSMTNGLFDVTAGGTISGRARWNGVSAEFAGYRCGAGLIAVSEEHCAIARLAESVSIDLGGIGKGYAVDIMHGMLEEWGIACAMVSGGGSTMRPTGLPPQSKAWGMRICDPRDERSSLRELALRDRAISMSSVVDEAHIIDPRTGEPSTGDALGGWALAPSAAEADALSTALVLMDDAECNALIEKQPQLGCARYTLRDGLKTVGAWPGGEDDSP